MNSCEGCEGCRYYCELDYVNMVVAQSTKQSVGKELKEISDKLEEEKKASYWISVHESAYAICAETIEKCRNAAKTGMRRCVSRTIKDKNVANKVVECLLKEELKSEIEIGGSACWVTVTW